VVMFVGKHMREQGICIVPMPSVTIVPGDLLRRVGRFLIWDVDEGWARSYWVQ